MRAPLTIGAVLLLSAIFAVPQPQTFEGALEEVNYKAPEFPPPALLAPPRLNEGMSTARGGFGNPQGVPPAGPPPLPAASPEATQAQSQAGLSSTGITWINSRPLTMRGLRGKVVLIDFWEYTCINCIRTFATNKRWYKRYHRDGFVLIGVHDPEFDIAYSVKNVRRAVKRFGLTYPVVVDDKFEIWNSYHSNSWPNRFLIDAKGNVRYHRVGEGGDGAFEHAIRKLLQEAHPGLKFPASETIPPDENAFAPSCGVPTAEMYVGDWSGRGVLANSKGYEDGKTEDYKLPASVEDGRVALEGKWRTEKSGMTYRGKKKEPGGGELEMRYHARELYSVMNVEHGHPSRLYILQDGKNLTRQDKGVDVQFDAQGRSYIEVREPRMYYLVQNPAFGSHSVVLQPTAPGITINSFTFGNNCQTDFPHL
ncbi:MAG TPA: redoxin domain-containing protein [Terriglobia bacterium]|nr:redoxin domain-containing protein [Terriglobia bacterium]